MTLGIEYYSCHFNVSLNSYKFVAADVHSVKMYLLMVVWPLLSFPHNIV